jgi:hypothetical protein
MHTVLSEAIRIEIYLYFNKTISVIKRHEGVRALSFLLFKADYRENIEIDPTNFEVCYCSSTLIKIQYEIIFH